MSQHTTLDDTKALIAATQLLRELEFTQAIKWKLKTRLKWLSLGDTSSKYFFNSVKQKLKRESMIELKLSNGEKTTDQKLIMNKITNFYTKLYKNDKGFE
jgi:hypothetical protein